MNELDRHNDLTKCIFASAVVIAASILIAAVMISISL